MMHGDDGLPEVIKTLYPGAKAVKCDLCDDLMYYRTNKTGQYKHEGIDQLVDYPEIVNEKGEEIYLGDVSYYYDSDGDYEFDATGEGREICSGCKDNIFTYGSMLTIQHLGKKHTVVFNSGLVEMHGNDFGLSNEFEIEVRAIVTGTTWKSVDGWRGYMESEPDNKIVVELWDDCYLSFHHSAALQEKIMLRLEKVADELEIPLFKTLFKSSNVLSTPFTVFVRVADYLPLKRVVDFLKKFYGADDYRWNSGILMHFDSQKPGIEAVRKQLEETDESVIDDLTGRWKDAVEGGPEILGNLLADHELDITGFEGLSYEGKIERLCQNGPIGIHAARMVMALKQLEETDEK